MIAKSTVCILSFCAMSALSTCFAQIPGDGKPDVYYNTASDPLIVNTSVGSIVLGPGELTVDTDGRDMVTVLIGSSIDVTSVPTNGMSVGCGLCDNGFLPDPNAPPFFVSSWTAGTIAGSNQWVRTSPLNTLGYQGVVGQDDHPGDIFPDVLANYGTFAQFDRVFEDDSGVTFEVLFATLDSGVFYTNVSGGFGGSYPPVANPDSYTIELTATLDTAASGLPGLLDNDFIPYGDDSFLSALGPDAGLGGGGLFPEFGSVTVAPDGSFVYVHDGSPSTTDTFSYFAVNDLDGSFDEGFVTINIVPEPSAWLLAVLGILALKQRGQP